MSTKQTDLYWANQETIVSEYDAFVKSHTLSEAKHALSQMTEVGNDVAPQTYSECLKIYQQAEMEEGDPNDEFREHQARAEEYRNEQMEAHFYPSEGPRI